MKKEKRRQTAEGWRRKVEQETGKRIRLQVAERESSPSRKG